MLVTVERYRQLTGDTTTPDEDVAEALEFAQDLADGYTRRPLESAERTETVTIDRRGHAFPRATPITLVEGGWRIAPGTPGTYLRSQGALWVWPYLVDRTAEVTYTGGYTPETVPAPLALALARIAWAHLSGTSSAGDGGGDPIPVGASSVRLGDAAVTFATTGGGGYGVGGPVGIPDDVLATLRGYRRRHP